MVRCLHLSRMKLQVLTSFKTTADSGILSCNLQKTEAATAVARLLFTVPVCYARFPNRRFRRHELRDISL